MRTQDFDLHRVRVIQTQARSTRAIAAGASTTSDGYLLGINTWTADKSVSEGIGFAITPRQPARAGPSAACAAAGETNGDTGGENPLQDSSNQGKRSMSTVRLRRLHADYEKIQEYVNRHPRLQLIQVEGSPPERYQLEYRIRGLRQTADELSVVKSHMVEVSLPVYLSAACRRNAACSRRSSIPTSPPTRSASATTGARASRCGRSWRESAR